MGIGVIIGCFINSGSVFVVDDFCLSCMGDDGLTIEGWWRGGGDGGGSTRGISIGIEGKNERTGEALVRFVTYNSNY